MPACTTCNLCSNPGSLGEATDLAVVPCNVRRLRNHSFTVWRCRNCNSLHSAEDVDLAFYYAHFPFQRHELDFHARVGYANRLRMLRERGFKRSDRLLDYGCGAGLFVKFLHQHGYMQAYGYDAFVPAYHCEDVREDQYDVVVCYDVIEHVPDPRQLAGNLASLLSTNGLLVIGTPNADHLVLNEGKLLTPELSQPYHRHILSERALLQVLAGHGLTTEHTSHRFYFDSFYPSVNTRFVWSYIEKTGGMIDVAVEPPQTGVVLRSPALWFHALFGYFYPPRGNITICARLTAGAKVPSGIAIPAEANALRS